MRLKYNLVETELGADLTDVATSITFTSVLTEGGVNVPTVVSPDVIALTIGGTEVVHLTAYTAGATSGTILREPPLEGTNAIAHTAGESVKHSPTKQDYGVFAVRLAASNSSSRDKLAADFICDGTADQVQIQQAIDYIENQTVATGRIEFASGLYVVAATSTVTASNIEFVGPAYPAYADSYLAATIQRGGASNYAIFTIAASSYASFEKLSIFDPADDANTSPLITIAASSQVRVQNSQLTNWQSDGIHITGSNTHLDISDAYVEATVALKVAGGTLTTLRVTVTDSELFGSPFAVDLAPGGAGEFVFDNVRTEPYRIDGNTGSVPMPKVLIHGGFVDAGSDESIYLTDISLLDISDVNIEGNSGAAASAIRVSNIDTGRISGCTIADATSGVDHHGIWVLDSDHLEIDNNSIYNASLATDNTYSGIILDGNTNNCFVHDNHIATDSAGNLPLYGIRVDDSTCDTNTVVNNDLRTSAKTAGNEFSDAGTGTVAGLEATNLDGWWQDNVAASQTAVALALSNGRTEIPMPAAGHVVGVAVYSNAARTTGTLTVDPTINGTVTGLTAVLDGTNTQTKATRQGNSADVFTAGQRIGVKITTDGTWAPTTADIDVAVLVVFDTANRI